MKKENLKFETQKLQNSNNEIIRPGNFTAGDHPAIYWGPDQYSNDADLGPASRIYLTPRAWKQNEFNRVPKVVRFIYDGYQHTYTQEGIDPPDGGDGDPLLSRDTTVGGWQQNAEGMTISFLCQDPDWVWLNPIAVYQLIGGEEAPLSFLPPFTPGPMGPSIGFPVNLCYPDTGEVNCAINGGEPDYSTRIAIYYQYPAFPAGLFIRIFQGTIAELDGQFGVHFTVPVNCRCWYRQITVHTQYHEGTVLIWETTVHYIQYYNNPGHGPVNENPDPGFNAGPHCIIDPEEPDPDFAIPGDFLPLGHAEFHDGHWVPA